MQIQRYYQENNSSAFHIAYNNLLIKLRAGYKAVWITAPRFPADEQHIKNGADMADKLADDILRTYYIDTSHIVSLYMIANTLRNLNDTKQTTPATTIETVSHQKETTKIISSHKANDVPNINTEKTLEQQLKELGIK